MAALRLIVGLGNPGAEHARTRHNAGFWFIDALAEQAGVRFGLESKLFGETAKVEIAGQTVWLLKPTTFMNLSGKSVTAALRYWKIEPDEMLVAAKIAFVSGARVADVAATINAVEARIRAAVPLARVVYLEPDVYVAPSEGNPATDAIVIKAAD